MNECQLLSCAGKPTFFLLSPCISLFNGSAESLSSLLFICKGPSVCGFYTHTFLSVEISVACFCVHSHFWDVFTHWAFCSTLKTFVCKRTASPSVTTNTTTCLKHFNLLYKDWLQEKCDSTTLSGLVSYVLFCKIHLQYKHMASLQKKNVQTSDVPSRQRILCVSYTFTVL